MDANGNHVCTMHLVCRRAGWAARIEVRVRVLCQARSREHERQRCQVHGGCVLDQLLVLQVRPWSCCAVCQVARGRQHEAALVGLACRAPFSPDTSPHAVPRPPAPTQGLDEAYGWVLETDKKGQFRWAMRDVNNTAAYPANEDIWWCESQLGPPPAGLEITHTVFVSADRMLWAQVRARHDL